MKSSILIAVFCCLSQLLLAQTNTVILDQVATIYSETDRWMHFPKASDIDVFDPKWIPIPEASTTYEVRKLELERRILEGDPGLQLKAGATYYSSGTFDMDNTPINSRARVELEWNVLKAGWLQNKTQAKVRDYKAQLLEQQSSKANIAAWRRKMRPEYTYAIHQELIELLNRKKAFLNLYFDVLNAMYAKKEIGREPLIKLGHALGVNNKEITHIAQLNDALTDSVAGVFNNLSLPLLELEQAPKINAAEIPRDTLLRVIQLDHHWTEDVSLSFFVNQNWDLVPNGQGTFTGAGVRLKIPLRNARRNEQVNLEYQRQMAVREQETRHHENQLITHFGTYREKIRDLKQLFTTWNVLEERKRVSMARKEALGTQETGLLLLDLIHQQFNVLEQVLFLKKQLYTVLSHLYELRGESLNTQPIVFQNTSNPTKVRVAITPNYSWDFQKHFLISKGVRTLYISEGETLLQRLWEKEGFEVKVAEQDLSMVLLEDWIVSELEQIKE
ncbi:MAG: hypothetical protein AAF466_06060 [Bacteroidota bacterium]